IPFSLENLPSSAWVYGGVFVCYGWVFSARCTRSDGVLSIFLRGFLRRFAGCFFVCRCFVSHRFLFWGFASWERIPECFDARKISPYLRAHRARLLCSIKAADQFLACTRRQSRDPQRGIRGRTRLRDVFLLRLECGSVYQQRDQAT